ncbi:MAG: SDR family NAD(P)-dependent oxidoreductase [Gammaproteobacteria bacterium]|nr:MAG: SDR family NAD(P)-dependent oxidoreductase [Gammaproteobacteria bacterium]
MSNAGKVILITGAGSGMGQLAARNFAGQGAKVAALDISDAGLAKTAENQPNIRTWKVDITDYAAVCQAVKEAESQLGPIDRVFNCAAIMPFGKLIEQDVGLQRKIMDINWGGLVNIANATLPAMKARGKGDFVSFASVAGLIPTLLTGAYSASKAAVVFYNETLYHENLGSGIRFASVCPPAVATPLLEQGKSAWPKMIDTEGAPINPQTVLDAIETALDKGQFEVFPTSRARIGAFMRRMMPKAIWKQVHKVEGW